MKSIRQMNKIAKFQQKESASKIAKQQNEKQLKQIQQQIQQREERLSAINRSKQLVELDEDCERRIVTLDRNDEFDNIIICFSKYNIEKAVVDHFTELNIDVIRLSIMRFASKITRTFMRELFRATDGVLEYRFGYGPHDIQSTICLRYPERGSIILVDWIRTDEDDTRPEPKQLKVRTIKTSEHTECPITCDVIETKCTTNCGHVFEHSALLKALEQNETCPVCRAEVNIIIL
jgi:hypothetical protein